MARRGENIYKRKDGRWEGRYIKGRRSDGKAIYGSVYGYKYGEVKAKLSLLKTVYANKVKKQGNYQGDTESFLNYWLENVAKPNIKQSTYAGYRYKLNRYVIPIIGKKPLQTIQKGDIDKVIENLQNQGLGAGSIHTIFRVIYQSFKKAVELQFVIDNPCDNVVLPKKQMNKVKALSRKELKQLEKIALKEKDCSPVILGLYTGMRIGEISALTWENVDLENDIIYVKYTMQRMYNYNNDQNKTNVCVGTPKSIQSVRIIPISANLKTYLREKKMKSDNEYAVSCRGSYAEPRVITYRFAKTMKAAGLKHSNFHCLRHSFATRVLECGVDVATLSYLLGHTSAKMTLDTYTDSMTDQKKRAVMLLDSVMDET